MFSDAVPNKDKARPLVYISMGTVINDRPELYARCIEALRAENVDVLISCGNAVDVGSLGVLPENVRVLPYVDQLEVLSRADVFLTHCGMNSVSESLYMATPMLLYPQTGEQQAVARRAAELGAGVPLKDDSAEGIRAAVREVLGCAAYADAAKACSDDFRACCGAAGAADFLESAPNETNGVDPMRELNRANGRFRIAYRLCFTAAIVLFGTLVGWRYAWILGVLGGLPSTPLANRVMRKKYAELEEK